MARKNNLSPSQMVGIFVIVIIVVPWFTILSEPGVIKKMYVIVSHNLSFYIAIFISLIFGVYRKFTNPNRFTWFELPVQLLASVAVIFTLYSFFFFTTSNISDKEVWNGYSVKAEFLEEWTERVETTTCDSEGKNCKTTVSYVYHPPEWWLYTNNYKVNYNEKISISRSVYRNYVNYFGNNTFKDLYHANQSSHGDGDMYYTVFKDTFESRIPTSIKHRYVNYLKGAESLHKKTGGNTIGYEKLLLDYPKVTRGSYGSIYFDRVIVAGELNVDSTWKKQVDQQLDLALTSLGEKKQVNIVVYLVKSSDQAFLHALEEHWINGKKNDVIVIVGMNQFPMVEWAAVMAWTKIEEFKIILRDNINELSDISDSNIFTSTILNQISKKTENGGYLRMPMEELEYLVSDIELPWWSHLLVVLSGAFMAWLVSWALINNQIKNWRRR